MASNRLLSLVVGVVVLWAVFALLQGKFGTCPRTPIWHRSRLTDLAYWFFTPLVTRAFTRGAAVVLLIGTAAVVGFRTDPAAFLPRLQAISPIAWLPAWAQLPLGLLVADFLGYWSHRLFHGRRLWRFHAIHHSATPLDWLSATRLHPINDVVSRVLTAAPLLLLGFDPKVFAAVAPVFGLYAIFVHANLPWDFGPLRYVVATPRFHRWHHSAEHQALDKNFAGLFPVFDLLFGTFYMPRGLEPRVFGIAERVPDGLLAQLAHPFRRDSSTGSVA